MNQYQQYISYDPDIRFGKPCIIHTRIAVADILTWLASGMSKEEIIADFPEIKQEHIMAALSFAANRENAIKTISNDKTAA
jgi:uncharacterized protein (DUF433 family)